MKKTIHVQSGYTQYSISIFLRAIGTAWSHQKKVIMCEIMSVVILIILWTYLRVQVPHLQKNEQNCSRSAQSARAESTQARRFWLTESVWTVCTLQCEGCQHDTAPIVLCVRAWDRDTSVRRDVYDTVQCSPHLSTKTASRHTPFTQTDCSLVC